MAALRAAYTPPLSLWKLVEQHVEPYEQDELKDMLGSSLVEQSLELHVEIDMLLEIWREVREENEESSRAQSALPEPPNHRDRLVQEICFFVDNVKEQAKRKGLDPEHILKNHNCDILDYAADKARPESARSRTSRSSDGRETPMAVLSPERIDLAYSMTDEVEAVNKQLNFLEFGKVCHSLRTYLLKEVEQLLQDVQFLQSCLDEAADVRDAPTPALSSREPTLTELREERSLLEKELFATEKMSSTPVVMKPIFNAASRVLPKTPPTPTGQRSPPPLPIKARASRAVQSNPGPMRANHQVLSFNSGSDNVTVDRESNELSGHPNLSNQLSPFADNSLETLEDEIFGLSTDSRRGSSRPGCRGGVACMEDDSSSDKEEDGGRTQLPFSTTQGDAHGMSSQSKPLHGMSKSGSCLDKGKSSVNSALPTPPSLPTMVQPTVTSGIHSDPLPSHSESNMAHYQPTPPNTKLARNIVSSGRARRRDVSPRPRLRVVDVTNLVEAHTGKGDSNIPCHAAERVINFSTSSSSTPSFTSPSLSDSTSVSPSPPGGLVERERGMRPGSASRFRKMVLGCRNGE